MREVQLERQKSRQMAEKGLLQTYDIKTESRKPKNKGLDLQLERQENEDKWVIVKYVKSANGRYKFLLVNLNANLYKGIINNQSIEISCSFQNNNIKDLKILDDKQSCLKQCKKEILSILNSFYEQEISIEQALDSGLNSLS